MPFAVMIASTLLLAAQPADETVVVSGRPWAPFISPMGEPFRPLQSGPSPIARWFAKADKNLDGILTPTEMQSDAERFFARLDSDHDGQIDPTEMRAYEWDIAPEIQVNDRWRRQRGAPVDELREDSVGDRPARPKWDRYDGYRTDGLQGAARYGLLDIPQPVAGADADFNRAVTLDEFRAAALVRFGLLDSARSGSLTLAQLEMRLPTRPFGKPPKEKKGAKDGRIGLPLPATP